MNCNRTIFIFIVAFSGCGPTIPNNVPSGNDAGANEVRECHTCNHTDESTEAEMVLLRAEELDLCIQQLQASCALDCHDPIKADWCGNEIDACKDTTYVGCDTRPTRIVAAENLILACEVQTAHCAEIEGPLATTIRYVGFRYEECDYGDLHTEATEILEQAWHPTPRSAWLCEEEYVEITP